jgi:hypothetical protein
VIGVNEELFRESSKVLSEVDQIDKKILKAIFRNSPTLKCQGPVCPLNAPAPISEEQEKKGKLPDDNEWVWNLYDRLSNALKNALEPMNSYLDTFSKMKTEIELNPTDISNDVKNKFNLECQD